MSELARYADQTWGIINMAKNSNYANVLQYNIDSRRANTTSSAAAQRVEYREKQEHKHPNPKAVEANLAILRSNANMRAIPLGELIQADAAEKIASMIDAIPEKDRTRDEKEFIQLFNEKR